MVATAVRQALPDDVVLLTAGGIGTRADAERALSAGVDVAVVGRAAIVHPDWPRVSQNADFVPMARPWSPEYLTSVDVGQDLLGYIGNFPGFVVGGAAARG